MIAGRMSEPSEIASVVADARDGAIVRVRVKPRSRRSGVLGVSDGQLSIAVRAAPEGGRATDEAIRTLAAWLGLPKSALTLSVGATSRSKRISVRGYSAAEIRARIGSRSP
jgi:uncharacterized protein